MPVSLAAANTNQPLQQPAGLNPVEQAACEEIMSRAADSEVVCIIRPRDPGGKSEVITLQQVSPEFVRALEEQAKRPTAYDDALNWLVSQRRDRYERPSCQKRPKRFGTTAFVTVLAPHVTYGCV